MRQCFWSIRFYVVYVERDTQGYYPDIYSAQEKWQEAGQKFRVLLVDWHLKFHLTCIVWSLPT